MLADIRTQLRVLLTDEYISDAELDMLIKRGEHMIERDMIADGQYKPRQLLTSKVESLVDVLSITLPADYHRIRTLLVNDQRLRYASPEKVGLAAEPTDINYTIWYYKRLTKLNDTENTWLEDIADELYLYAASLHYVPHMKDDPRVNLWQSFYASALNSVCQSNASQPTGSWQEWKGRPYKGLYTIEGDLIRLS